MNKISKIICSVLILPFLFLAGCASVPSKPNESNSFIIKQSLQKSHQAAIDTLTVLGFEIKLDTNAYVQGFRPHKMGLLVGSGGETIGIWLEEIGPDETRVLAKTAKSFVGIVGQKNWDTDIKIEMMTSNK